MNNDLTLIDQYLKELSHVIDTLPRKPLLEILNLLRQAQTEGRQVFIFGNGGSAATSSHMVCDFIKNTRRPDRKRMKVIGLADNMPTFSAYANDEGYEQVFVQPLESLGQIGDLVIAISGSGNSPNVLRAVEQARQNGIVTIGLTGFAGGKLAELVDVCLIIPSQSMEQIEDMHMVVDHLLTVALRAD